MENSQSSYLKTDNNKVINEQYIRWIKKCNECLEVCIRSNGCSEYNTHQICKLKSPSSYEKLNKYFN